MKISALIALLSKQENCTHNDNKIEIAEGTEVTLYVSLGGEALMLSNLVKIEFTDEEMMIVHTRKEEMFALLASNVRVMRVGASSTKQRTGLLR